MIYLDTGCLLKLYYPEPESRRVVELVAGNPIVYLSLHELEATNALQLKRYRKEATASQVDKTRQLLTHDLQAGVLHRPALSAEDLLQDSVVTAGAYTGSIGCRSLDILHCVAARHLAATSFVTTDKRQRKLATKLGLHCPSV